MKELEALTLPVVLGGLEHLHATDDTTMVLAERQEPESFVDTLEEVKRVELEQRFRMALAIGREPVPRPLLIMGGLGIVMLVGLAVRCAT